ncbi:DUF2911 domain-containing protein [Ichthyenterobacterium magnum]|uniref:DUF2911 family protein n=1 Tax=Ichthyenterobacterium magnum TaxID=1230530 RepID=A0A420DUP0_9FLAO|nr:DUF2911 domain-containing protein [Ichthyenterobacterium magnum]RKE98021.1 Protein of unknown function (DUF2911) [Ichthyenterobacterium magnum]
MNTFLKRLLILLSIIAIGLFLYSYFVEDIFSKRLSPKDTVEFKLNDLELNVFYNRPSKKGREIFGALVPYNKVWRTGANEATTFSTNKNLMIEGHYLPYGDYTLWTIPNDTSWQVMFNSKQYPWGVNEQMQPMREPKFDLININVPTENLNTIVEQFTIAFDNTTDNLKLTMAWDNTKIAVPLKVIKDAND